MSKKFKRLISCVVALMLIGSNLCYADDISEIATDVGESEQIENDVEEQTVLLSEVAENNAVTFDLSGATIKLSTMYGNAENTEKIYIPGNELILKVSAENAENASVSFSLIFALYDAEDRLVEVNTYTETISPYSQIVNKTVKLHSSSNAVRAKVMVWESNQTLKPYCEAISLTQNGEDAHGAIKLLSTVIKPEDTVIGKINSILDVDYFKFVPTKDFTSDLNITGQAEFKVYDSLLSLFEMTPVDGKYNFEANKSYYIKVSGTLENLTPVYSFQLEKPLSHLGAEYEQIKSDLPNLTAPKITDVGVDVLNFVNGKYKITLDIDDCIYDSRAQNTFFYWESADGTISDATVNADGSISFTYQANKGTGDRTVRLVIGFGDGLGQIDRKALLLKGNEVE